MFARECIDRGQEWGRVPPNRAGSACGVLLRLRLSPGGCGSGRRPRSLLVSGFSEAKAFRPDGRVTSFCLSRKKSPRKRAPRVRAGRASGAAGSLRCSPDQGRCATRTSLCSDMLAFPLIQLRSSALPRGPMFLRPGFLPGFRGGLCRETCGWGTGAEPEPAEPETDAEPEVPDAPGARKWGAFFLGYFFLGKQKEVTRPPGRNAVASEKATSDEQTSRSRASPGAQAPQRTAQTV